MKKVMKIKAKKGASLFEHMLMHDENEKKLL
jgi:hypothetical protein